MTYPYPPVLVFIPGPQDLAGHVLTSTGEGFAYWAPPAVPEPAAPIGSIVMWPGASVPSGWLECNGAVIAAEEFPELAEVLGGTVLPDLRDRFPLGAATRPLGSTGGALGHTHAQPAHTHSVDPPATASGGPSGPNTIGVSLLGLGAAASTAHTHVTDVPSFTSGAGGGDATGSADPPYLALRFIIRAT